jgi:DMSO/TMAO reductase YedYZ heme-binding membrane subunit
MSEYWITRLDMILMFAYAGCFVSTFCSVVSIIIFATDESANAIAKRFVAVSVTALFLFISICILVPSETVARRIYNMEINKELETK